MSNSAEQGFTEVAARLAGQAGVAFGWPPDRFWCATPAELMALVQALSGADANAAPPDKGMIAAMMEAFPDG